MWCIVCLAFEVGDAGWTCGWHETPLGLMIRTDIVIIILRAQQPVTIKYTGLPQIQLETFSSILKGTSFPYVTPSQNIPQISSDNEVPLEKSTQNFFPCEKRIDKL
ncbi:unnamed protein product [Spodoptera exigua]|nr:unnamed protein product [Spodoptera exigua]